jgi:hypothetical protein
MSSLPASTKPERISDIMRRLMDGAARGDTVNVGHILHVFGVRGFAFIILMLALLNIVIFMVPFISFLFGLPMVILAVQMVLGLRTPIFPKFIRHQTIRREPFLHGLEKAVLWMSKVERYIRPRFAPLSDPLLNRIHGMLALVLAVMVTLPIPLFNILPSIGLALLAIGMMQRDGLFIVASYVVGGWSLILFRSIGQHIAHSFSS